MINKFWTLALNLTRALPLGKARAIKALVFLNPGLKMYYYKFRPDHKFGIYLNLADDTCIGLFLKNGIDHERGLQSLLSHICSPEKVFWDAGCNYGYYPVFLNNYNLCKVVYGFEPNSFCTQYLSKTLQPITNAKLLEWGLGDEEKEVLLYFNEHSSDLGSITNVSINNRLNTAEKITVKTIDSLLQELEKPDILKIDVEGYEYFVVKGYSKLNEQRPVVILEWIEENQKNNNINFDMLLSLFSEGWVYYFIGHDGNLYQNKSDKCGSDVVFCHLENSSINKIKQLVSD